MKKIHCYVCGHIGGITIMNIRNRKQTGKWTEKFLPTKTLGYLSKAIDRKQEGCVSVTTQALQKILCRSKSLLCRCVVCYHCYGVKYEMFQVVSKLLVMEELRIWPTVVG